MQEFDVTVPVLVVGGGACGSSAALAVREAGVDVLVEREAVPRGTTAMSQGLVCAAGTTSQRSLGIDDDADRFFDDILLKTRGLVDRRLARAIATHAGPVLDNLIDRYDFPWQLDTGFRAAYGHSRMRVHGWYRHGGIDMIELLQARVAAAGVDVMTNARMTAIVADGAGGVAGIEIERPDGSRERIGCRSLVLAAGGFAANQRMVKRWMPDAANARCHSHEGSQGDAIEQAAALGAALGDMGAYQGYAMLTEPQGISVPPGLIVEGGVMVNGRGERFVDEAADISGMVHAVLAQPGGQAWVIYDATMEQRCGYVPEMQQLIALRAPRDAADLPALAAALHIGEAALRAVFADLHAAGAVGGCDAFGRSWNEVSAPQPPYRALRVVGALYHTQGGLQIDDSARVVDATGRPFRNLWAGGGSARGVSGPASWGYLPAMGLCAALTLGTLAGRSAAAAAMSVEPGASTG